MVSPPMGLAVAAEKNADEPALPATADDLSNATRNISSKVGTPAAHNRLTRHNKINFLGEEMGERQSVNFFKQKGEAAVYSLFSTSTSPARRFPFPKRTPLLS